MEEIYNAYLTFWLGLSSMLASFVVIAVVWAIKNKQFSNQERAGRLPLISGIPDKEDDIKDRKN